MRVTAAILSCLFAATAARAEETMINCTTLADFSANQRGDWRAVNDGVMGGRSQGGPAFNQDRLVFSGVIDTDGGGFSSVRAPFPSVDLSDRRLFRVRVNPDERAYALTIRSWVTFRGRSISYRGELAGVPAGQWTDIDIAFDALTPTVFGRRVPAPPFDPADALSLGLIISDGVDGAFRLDVDAIKAC